MAELEFQPVSTEGQDLENPEIPGSEVEDRKEVVGDDGLDSNPRAPTFCELLALSKRECGGIVVAIICMFAGELLGLLNPLLIGRAYDALVDSDASNEEKRDRVAYWMTRVLIIMLIGMVFGFFRGYFLGSAGERVVARLRCRLYRAILAQEIAFFDQRKTGELVSRLGTDTTIVQGAATSSLPETLIQFVKIIVSISIMSSISGKLTGLVFGFFVALMTLVVPFGGFMGTLNKKYQDALGVAQTCSTEAIGAVRTVRAFAGEEAEALLYDKLIGDPDQRNCKVCWWPSQEQSTYRYGVLKAAAGSGFFSFAITVTFGMLNLILWFSFKEVVHGNMTVGDLTAFQQYIFGIIICFGASAGHVMNLINAKGASARIFEILERVPTIPLHVTAEDETTKEEKPVTIPQADFLGQVSFHNVSFFYPTRPDIQVLNDFTLELAPNSTCALVGSSGCGKSTVLSLLQRLYDVRSGSVCIDGRDIRELDPAWLHGNIGVVSQEPALFGRTIKGNVCYGCHEDVSEAVIHEACKQANAHEFITEFSDGYDTLVGERGVRLSGGQKQRIAIARALIKNPPILLLDEATSALDAESEHVVQEAIEKVMQGRTVLIVAHRLSTVRDADKIVVVDDHHIVDVGTHDTLMERCEKYNELVQRQLNAGQALESGLDGASVVVKANAKDQRKVTAAI